MDFFNRVKRQTPESVELEFLLAGVGSRAYALVVDYTLLTVALTLLLLVASLLAVYLVAALSAVVGAGALTQWLVAIAALLGFALYVGYFVLFESIQNGQTPGKKLAKIQVVRDDGRPVEFFQAVLRALVRPLDDFLWIGFFLIVFGQQEKRLGDLLAGTLVVQTQSAATLTKSVDIPAAAYELAPQLRATLNLNLILPDDFAVLREYFQRRSAMRPDAAQQLTVKLANEVLGILELQALPPNVGPQLFLEAIYVACQEEH